MFHSQISYLLIVLSLTYINFFRILCMFYMHTFVSNEMQLKVGCNCTAIMTYASGDA